MIKLEEQNSYFREPLPSPRIGDRRKAPTVLVVSYIALGVALVGSFLPWARVLFFTVNGTDGDGILTALASGAALIFLLSHHRSDKEGRGLVGFASVGALATSAVYIYSIVNLAQLNNEPETNEMFEITVTPQFGLLAGAVGAVVGAISTLKFFVNSKKKQGDAQGSGSK